MSRVLFTIQYGHCTEMCHAPFTSLAMESAISELASRLRLPVSVSSTLVSCSGFRLDTKRPDDVASMENSLDHSTPP